MDLVGEEACETRPGGVSGCWRASWWVVPGALGRGPVGCCWVSGVACVCFSPFFWTINRL